MKQITTYPNTDSLALPTPPLAHGPDHAQARALALQVVPPTAYHAQFSVEQRAAYNLAQAYLALAPQPSAPPQERVSEAMVETLAKRLAAEAYVDTRHRDLLPVEPFSWDVMLTDFQREQWSGRARLHLDAALSAGRGE